MTLYCGIDLHSNNHFVCLIDRKDHRVIEQKLSNNLSQTVDLLTPHKKKIHAIAVESTFNWYWLVDGLIDAGFEVVLVNTAKVIQYEGLKNTDDRYDAFHLA